MLIQSVYRGRTFKDVTILDAANHASDDLVAAALKAADETPHSNFGTQVRRYPEGSALETIFTD